MEQDDLKTVSPAGFPMIDPLRNGWSENSTCPTPNAYPNTHPTYSESGWEEWMRWEGPQAVPSKAQDSQSYLNVHALSSASTNQPDQSDQHALMHASHPMSQGPAFSISTMIPPCTMDPPATSMAFTFGSSVDHSANMRFEFTDSPVCFQLRSDPRKEAVPSQISADWDAKPQRDATTDGTATPPFLPVNNTFKQVSTNISTPSLHHSPDSVIDRYASSASPRASTEPVQPAQTRKKRKASTEEGSIDEATSAKPPVKKTTHNMIEKKYRTNLNNKIAALRDCVPSLRAMARSQSNGDAEDQEDLEGMTPAHKLNKATVLSQATEYIHQLKKRLKTVTEERDAYKIQYEQLQKMQITTQAPLSDNLCSHESLHLRENPVSQAPSADCSRTPVHQNLQMQETMLSFHHNHANIQPHYADPGPIFIDFSSRQRREPGGTSTMTSGVRGNPLPARLMVGTLAAIMLYEGLTQREGNGQDPRERGLSSIPVQFLTLLLPKSRILGISTHMGFSILKAILIIMAFMYALSPFIRYTMVERARRPIKVADSLSPAPPVASPIIVRRKAWLTAITTVWVPRHSFVLEIAALGLKMLKLSTRTLIGWKWYAIVTGTTREQESARVNAWEIALDAQLTGGDAEISMSRLLLTFLASGTLPDTPARYMLKALHIRVLFLEAANAGYGTQYMLDSISAKLARSYWRAARNQQSTAGLPEHLITLLGLDSDSVLLLDLVKRVYSLARNIPQPGDAFADDILDTVLEDWGISSPLDALAAWWSGNCLASVLVLSLSGGDHEQLQATRSRLNLAIEAAPPHSVSRIRALVARAVLSADRRGEYVLTALDTLSCCVDPLHSGSRSWTTHTLLNMIVENPLPRDMQTALTLAKCLHLASSQMPESRCRAVAGVNNFFPTDQSFSLLSFAASFKVLEVFTQDAELAAAARGGLERIATTVRVWVGGEGGSQASLSGKIKSRVVEKCLLTSKSLMGILEVEEESDAGYVSQSDGEVHDP